MKPPSRAEADFMAAWQALGGPDLEREYRFHPPRRWRFDFAHLTTQTAIEIEGGVWARGRHTRGAGFVKDCEKYNQAAADGWTVFRLAGHLITDTAQLRQIALHIEVQYGEER